MTNIEYWMFAGTAICCIGPFVGLLAARLAGGGNRSGLIAGTALGVIVGLSMTFYMWEAMPAAGIDRNGPAFSGTGNRG